MTEHSPSSGWRDVLSLQYTCHEIAKVDMTAWEFCVLEAGAMQTKTCFSDQHSRFEIDTSKMVQAPNQQYLCLDALDLVRIN